MEINPAPHKFYYVYLLYNRSHHWHYIGATQDLKKRVLDHKEGKCYTTKRYLPLELVYYEAYASKTDAFAREKKLKQYGNGLKMIKKRTINSLGGAG